MKKLITVMMVVWAMHAEAQNVRQTEEKLAYLPISYEHINHIPEPTKHWDLFHIGEGFFRIDGIDEDKEAELFFLGWPKMEERMGTSLSVMSLKLYKPDIKRIAAKDMEDMIARSPLVYQRLHGCGEQ